MTDLHQKVHQQRLENTYHLFTRDGRYFVHFYDHGKRRAASTKIDNDGKLKSRDAADRFVQDLRDKRELRVKEEVLFGDYARDFFNWETSEWIRKRHAKGHPFGRGMADARQGHVENYLVPKWGKLFLSEITDPEKIDKWLQSLELENQTRNHLLYTFAIIMRQAKAEKKIEANPLDEVEPYGKQSRKRDVLSIAEIAKLFPHETDKLLKVWGLPERAVAMMVLASTGVRSGELRALTWEKVFWNERALIIDAGVKIKEGIGETKTGKPRVELLPSRTQEALEWWQGMARWTDPEDLIFCHSRGTPRGSKWLSGALPAALERAKIQIGTRCVVPHSMRHYFTTRMKNTLSEEMVQRLTGHSSEKMTRHYDHPEVVALVGRLAGARDAVEGLLP